MHSQSKPIPPPTLGINPLETSPKSNSGSSSPQLTHNPVKASANKTASNSSPQAQRQQPHGCHANLRRVCSSGVSTISEVTSEIRTRLHSYPQAYARWKVRFHKRKRSIDRGRSPQSSDILYQRQYSITYNHPLKQFSFIVFVTPMSYLSSEHIPISSCSMQSW